MICGKISHPLNSLFYFCNLSLTMKFVISIVILLALSETLLARPIPDSDRRRSVSIPWRKYLPTLGAIGLIGTLAGLVFLGTKADEAFKSAKVVTESETDARYQSLSPKDRNYLLIRMGSLGEELPKSDRESREVYDKMNGWPEMEMPDVSGMDRATRKEIKSKYRKLESAMNKVALLQESVQKATDTLKRAEVNHTEAKYVAAVIAATEWKEALDKATGQSSKDIP